MAKKFSELVARMSPESRAESAARAREMLRELPLIELRRQRSISHEALAKTLGTTPTRVGRLEDRSHLYLTSLRRYVEAMGGTLEITARFPDGEIRLHEWQAWVGADLEGLAEGEPG